MGASIVAAVLIRLAGGEEMVDSGAAVSAVVMMVCGDFEEAFGEVERIQTIMARRSNGCWVGDKDPLEQLLELNWVERVLGMETRSPIDQ